MAERGRKFAGVVDGSFVRWGFTFAPAETGTTLTEAWEFLPGGIAIFEEKCGEQAQAQSTHIPLHSLLQRIDEVPDGQLWVHCASGYRASITASLLDRAGYHVVLVDDDYATAVKRGLATA